MLPASLQKSIAELPDEITDISIMQDYVRRQLHNNQQVSDFQVMPSNSALNTESNPEKKEDGYTMEIAEGLEAIGKGG